MLRKGASLQTISGLLRHQSLDTTALYAKVDVEMLSEIAQPWPEEVLPMSMQAIDSYLQLRRAGGYQLRDTEVLLKEFACFAAERGEIHIKAETAIAWASRATSLHQRARRLNSLILFARYIRAEDADHQVPPSGVFGHPPCSRPLPHIFTPTQIAAILAEGKQLPPAGSLRPLTF